MSKKITLDAWAATQYDPPPANGTLLQWVKHGRILPAPVKVGRAYYVSPDAKHVAEVQSEPTLLRRLRAA